LTRPPDDPLAAFFVVAFIYFTLGFVAGAVLFS